MNRPADRALEHGADLKLDKRHTFILFYVRSFLQQLDSFCLSTLKAIQNRQIHLLGVSTMARGCSSFIKCSRSCYIRLSPLCFLLGFLFSSCSGHEGRGRLCRHSASSEHYKGVCCQLRHGRKSKDIINTQ